MKKEKWYSMSEHGYKNLLSLIKEMHAEKADIISGRTSAKVYRDDVERSLVSIAATVGEMK